MSDWEGQVAAAHSDYSDALEQRGFVGVGQSALDGTVTTDGGLRKITVLLHPGFPFLPPCVHIREEEVPRSWHLDPDDYMCLYTEDDYNAAPWCDADAFLRRVVEWFDQADAGWPDDVPVLDAERYLHADAASPLLIYDDLSPFLGGYARLREEVGGVVRFVTTNPPRKKQRRDRRRYARVFDVGELSYPPRGWDDIRALIPSADQVEQEIHDYTVCAVVLIYSRRGHEGVLAARVFPLQGGGIGATAYKSASCDTETVAYRGGPYRQVLASKDVLIVGVGAVGSFLADMLARSGIGALTLRDGDILKPGNVIRHLCGQERVGESKAEAVKYSLRHLATDVVAVPTSLVDAFEAAALIRQHDLVIDASANGAVTSMLGAAASSLGCNALSVCVQNDGDSVRVDVIRPLSGKPLERTVQRSDRSEKFFEGGCGDPVSPTPPFAVIEAAALAARHTVGLLVEEPVHPAGELREYPQATGEA